MSNYSFSVPSLGQKFSDYRSQIMGDSYNWYYVRPLSQPKYLTIHHSASPDTQTPEIARYHVQSRGWGGIGYHFVIAKDGHVFYVGDLGTARANVVNLNHLVIGVCLIGNFINGSEPTTDQRCSAHELCSQLLFRTPDLSGIDSWDCLVGHQQLQATTCPGDTWTSWRNSIIVPPSTTSTTDDLSVQISKLYRTVLGREPDQDGLANYIKSGLTVDQIRQSLVDSDEHRLLIQKASSFRSAKTLATESLNLISQGYTKIEEITKLS